MVPEVETNSFQPFIAPWACVRCNRYYAGHKTRKQTIQLLRFFFGLPREAAVSHRDITAGAVRENGVVDQSQTRRKQAEQFIGPRTALSDLSSIS